MNKTKKVQEHYDASVDEWREQYNPDRLSDPEAEYPANQFRLKLLLESFKKKKIKRVIEVGFGEGTPLVELSKLGFDVCGFDLSPKMVDAARENFKAHGLDPDLLWTGDIQQKQKTDIEADALLAMGVMPHVENDRKALENMRDLVKPGGSVFIEFRNSLFSLFTMNRYTQEFIVNDLLKDVTPGLRGFVAHELCERVRMDMPPVRETSVNGTGPGYDTILSKFHNPLVMPAVFESLGFKDIKLVWYHYHPAMPYLRDLAPALFLKEATKLEGDQSWRGYFLCSAFVVEAIKK